MIAPMTNEVVLNVQTCFTLNGTKDAVVEPQQALPDTSKFTVRFAVFPFLVLTTPYFYRLI